MRKLLKSEIILHEKFRNKTRDLEYWGFDKFTVASIDEDSMSTVLLALQDDLSMYSTYKGMFKVELLYRESLKSNKNTIKNDNKMKRTIFVIYTDQPVKNPGYQKRYTFNTSADIEIGDMLDSPAYKSKMQVVEILDEAFKYFNRETGKLGNRIKSSNDYKIRTLNIMESVEDTIVAVKL